MLICQPQGVKRSIVDGLIVSGGASFFVCFLFFSQWENGTKYMQQRERQTDNLCQMPVVLFLHAGNMKTVCFLCMVTDY